jgi:hypothetical protein
MAINDEPVYDDYLEHHVLARGVGHRILKCNPPYVVGVCGSWGSGKTSFLRKVWAYLGGEFDVELPDKKKWTRAWLEARRNEQREGWFKEKRAVFDQHCQDKWAKVRPVEVIWFNPWQHQFETTPLVALLNEIRQQFTLKYKLFDEAGKLGDVAVHATLNALAELGKELKIPLPSAKSIVERGREYEAETFSNTLSSQRFREFFEKAIQTVTGENGLLVIFIDDLDRCEGEVAYRLLEALKLYLNAKNCVYVLGLDQQHLESSIAKALSGEKETWRYRPIARDYLSKIFQNLFLLPVPRQTNKYVRYLLDEKEPHFRQRLKELFHFDVDDERQWQRLTDTLDRNLPHNPRKLKAFVTSWKLYLDALATRWHGEKLDWRLTVVLHYLAQFEEPLFRKIEESPGWYNRHLVRFCQTGVRIHYLFDDGLELPDEPSAQGGQTAGGTGGYSTTLSASTTFDDSSASGLALTVPVYPRAFWISRLIREMADELGTSAPEKAAADLIERHLLHTGDLRQAPAAPVPGNEDHAH